MIYKFKIYFNIQDLLLHKLSIKEKNYRFIIYQKIEIGFISKLVTNDYIKAIQYYRYDRVKNIEFGKKESW